MSHMAVLAEANNQDSADAAVKLPDFAQVTYPARPATLLGSIQASGVDITGICLFWQGFNFGTHFIA